MIILTALMLAAQPAPRPRAPVAVRRPAATFAARPTADWLSGLWVSDAKKGAEMEGCADWTAVFYQSDGHLVSGELAGRWKLVGDRVHRQKISFNDRAAEGGGDEGVIEGPEEIARIVRLSDDRFREIGADGKATLYLRCPKPETPVAR
jgi:hypothetical protein